MPLPLLGLASGLFGGGATSGAAGISSPDTLTTGPISFGSKVIGRGASQSTASGGAVATATPVASAAASNPATVPIIVAGATVAVVLLAILLRRKG